MVERFQGADCVHGIRMHRDHDHLRLGAPLVDEIRGLCPVQFGHGAVHEDDVRLGLHRPADGPAPVPNGPDDFHVRLRLDEMAQPLRDHIVIIDDENSDRHVSRELAL